MKITMDQLPDVWRPFAKPRGTRDPVRNLDARAQAFLERIAPLSADLETRGPHPRLGAPETAPDLPGRGPQAQSQLLPGHRQALPLQVPRRHPRNRPQPSGPAPQEDALRAATATWKKAWPSWR